MVIFTGHSVHIFDFDGTLVDSMPCWVERIPDILRMNGVEYPHPIPIFTAKLSDAWNVALMKLCFSMTIPLLWKPLLVREYTLWAYIMLLPKQAFNKSKNKQCLNT